MEIAAAPAAAAAAMPVPSRPSIDDAPVSPRLPRSDREIAADAAAEQRHAAEAALTEVARLLAQADAALADVTDQGLLGTAIVRGCRDLADGAAALADRLEGQSDAERRALARACLRDAEASLRLLEEEAAATVTGEPEAGHPAPEAASPESATEAVLARQSSQELADMSEREVEGAIQAAASLLRDVEATLRAIDRDEAEEIADVALTVARMFVASLQSIQATITPEHLIAAIPQSNMSSRSGPQIDILDSDDEDAAEGQETPALKTPKSGTTSAVSASRNDRLRVLWPPLGPAVESTLQWGKESASQKPLLAVALGLTLWPYAIATCFVAAPVVLVDKFVQGAYNDFQDGPIIQSVERLAAQAYQTGRLSFLCGRLMVRQTLRVVSRQVDRHGGVGRIAQHAGEFALHRVTHPVETAQMVWGGILWGAETTAGIWRQLNDREQDETAQRLQQ